MQEIQRQAEILRICFGVCAGLGGLWFLIATVLFFLFDIRKIWNDRTGRSMKKAMKKMEECRREAGAPRGKIESSCKKIGAPRGKIGASCRKIGASCRKIGAPCRETGALCRETGASYRETGASYRETEAPYKKSGILCRAVGKSVTETNGAVENKSETCETERRVNRTVTERMETEAMKAIRIDTAEETELLAEGNTKKDKVKSSE